jgi:hypothetical protein
MSFIRRLYDENSHFEAAWAAAAVPTAERDPDPENLTI